MWVKILKYAVKAAVASGLADKAVKFLKDKLRSAADKAKDKLVAKVAAKYEQLEKDAEIASK